MSSLQHMALSARRTLFARRIFLESVEETGIDQECDRGFQAIQQSWLNLANDELTAERGRRLDEAVMKLAESTKTFADSLGNNLNNRVLRALYTARNKISDLNCAACTGGPVCTGREGDHALVARGGLCISGIKEAFEVCREIAQLYYKHYLPPHLQPHNVSVELSTQSDEVNHKIPAAVQATAKTAYQDTPSTLISQVTLTVDPKKYDLFTEFALTYLFAHECVCHAFQWSAPVGPDRSELTDADEYDLLSEGWMDYVSFKCLDQVSEGKGPAAHLQSHLRGSIVDASRTFYLSRCDTTRAGIHPPNARAIQRGRAAAAETHRFLDELLDPELARDALFRLSFGLNAMRANVGVRYQMVVNTLAGLALPSREYGTAATVALTSFSEHGDPATFVRELLGEWHVAD